MSRRVENSASLKLTHVLAKMYTIHFPCIETYSKNRPRYNFCKRQAKITRTDLQYCEFKTPMVLTKLKLRLKTRLYFKAIFVYL